MKKKFISFDSSELFSWEENNKTDWKVTLLWSTPKIIYKEISSGFPCVWNEIYRTFKFHTFHSCWIFCIKTWHFWPFLIEYKIIAYCGALNFTKKHISLATFQSISIPFILFSRLSVSLQNNQPTCSKKISCKFFVILYLAISVAENLFPIRNKLTQPLCTDHL